ncbi:cysteinyl-tRNA synthetase [methanotrophic bacterial endosymbiont of Bathymodiolus sp.]|nr:cysteinyl-tRNA synthetase [methanotrophic bacterial endosymbiont of Bathymodiolus sp.]
MDDDFNTPVAVAVLFDMAKELNKEKNNNSELGSQLAGELKELSNVLGILQDDPENFLQAGETVQEGSLAEQEIELFIEQRTQAKQNKDWALADKIRNDLKQQGIVLEDVATGTSWRRE